MLLFVCLHSYLPRPLSTQRRTRRLCNFNNAIAGSSNIVYLTRLMTWADHFPPDCPGSDAVPAEGQVWRLVRSAPPREADFKSNKLQQPRKDWGDQECEACGLSVYRTEGDAARVRELTPAFRKRLVASGTLTANHGVT